ncbi:Uncharacterised protein [Mycobacteroides abscessus subsp. abscessus]|nr:Uncharacterised protein [Mycobacteroides abscessus subsp. abscessus]
MPASTSALARTAAMRPSTVSRSYWAIAVVMTNSKRGLRPSMSSRIAASPFSRRRSLGSRPEGSTATKVCAVNSDSNSKALSAAFCPASSPSKVKTTCALGSSPMRRRTILTCSAPKAVPHVATAWVTPARWAAMTSV